ncbi:hypothetical protein JE952_002453, partial [Flavobacterium psychrophilum]|nr:hypothetical protein [Flavobacterium psychrophilum]
MENNIINKENFDNAKSFLNQVTELATKSNENLQLTNQKLQNTSDLLNKAGNIYLESKKIDNDNLKLKNELVTIVSDFKIKQGYLHAIFDERSRIIDKHFEVIDKGIRENNDELILKGLRGASE